MTADLYAELDDARRAFITAADRLSNATTRADVRNALLLTVDAQESLTALRAVLKTIEREIAAEIGQI